MAENKYKNKKVKFCGIEFDSKREANRYAELKLMERAGLITDLQRQKSYLLIPGQYIDGKCVERGVNYKADFSYLDKNGTEIVEDTKGFKTPEYIIKRKLMLYIHHIRVREV